jgi:hypothetical protein
MAFPEILLGSKFDAKGFKQAESAVTKLNSGVKNLARTFGVAFGAAALITYSKRAIKAFADDEKAARSLSVALANTGNAFASIGVEKFIDDLQRTTGVLDDNLRPAFRTLLTATGDVTKSQKALSLALDISAGTGKDLGSVSSALAKGFSGQTTALSRLGAGLSKATLASGDMDAIMTELNSKFSGQSSAAVQGYAGQIAVLNVALANSAEIIGKDLLDSINLISGANGIGKTTSAIENMATTIGNAVFAVASLINRLKGIYQDTFIGDMFNLLGKLPNLRTLGAFGAAAKARSAGNPAQSPGQRKAIDKANADALKLAKTKNTLSKIDNDNTTRKLVLTADQLALIELEKKFDVERIGLYAALNQSTSDETKMRLLSLIAIYDQNAALAGMIKKANETENAFASLTETLRTVIRGMLDAIAGPLAALQNAVGVAPSMSAPAGFSAIIPSMPGGYEGFGSGMSDLGSGNYGGLAGAGRYGGGGSTVVVNVAGSVSTERDLVDAITQGIYNNQAAGIPINYSTVY